MAKTLEYENRFSKNNLLRNVVTYSVLVSNAQKTSSDA